MYLLPPKITTGTLLAAKSSCKDFSSFGSRRPVIFITLMQLVGKPSFLHMMLPRDGMQRGLMYMVGGHEYKAS